MPSFTNRTSSRGGGGVPGIPRSISTHSAPSSPGMSNGHLNADPRALSFGSSGSGPRGGAGAGSFVGGRVTNATAASAILGVVLGLYELVYFIVLDLNVLHVHVVLAG